MAAAAGYPPALTLRPAAQPRTSGVPGSSVDLAHDDVDAADDGRHVGNQTAATQFVRHAQVREATRPRPHTQRHALLRGSADHMETHLPARAFRFNIAFARRKLSRWLHAMRVLRLEQL